MAEPLENQWLLKDYIIPKSSKRPGFPQEIILFDSVLFHSENGTDGKCTAGKTSLFKFHFSAIGIECRALC